MNYSALDFNGWSKEDFRGFSTREDWALRLGISAKTLSRYEREILEKAPDRLPQAFYWQGRRGRNRLDFYQKTILWIIQKLTSGEAYADQKMSYEQVQRWFSEIDQRTGKRRILSLSRPLVKENLDLV